MCVICRIKKRDFIKWERLSIFMGPREGASREEMTEDREVIGANKKNKSQRAWREMALRLEEKLPLKKERPHKEMYLYNK